MRKDLDASSVLKLTIQQKIAVKQKAGAKGCWRGQVPHSWGRTGLRRWKGMQTSGGGGCAVLQAKFKSPYETADSVFWF